MNWYFMGVDFGQRRDHTAIAVIERAEEQGKFDSGTWTYRKNVALRLRYLERVPLGTSYPEIVNRVLQITNNPPLANRCHLAVDATGVGVPLVDLLHAARREAVLMPVMVTGGQKETLDRGMYHVPKRDLIVGLQLLLEQGGLEIAQGLPYAHELMEELMSIQIKISPAGNEQFAAWREGTHDDLVFAVALAYWNVRKLHPPSSRSAPQCWENESAADAEYLFRRYKSQEPWRSA